MKRTNIHLTDQQREWLTDYSRAIGLPVADLIRRAIDKTYPQIRSDRRGHRPLTRERAKDASGR